MLLVCIHSFSVMYKIMFGYVVQAEEEEVDEEEEEDTKSEDNEVDAEKDDEDDDTPAHEELQKVEANQYLWKY